MRRKKIYKRLWKERPDEMRRHLAKATDTASRNKRTRRDELIRITREMLGEIGDMDTEQLTKALRMVVHASRNKRSIVTNKQVKALRMMLCRHKVIAFDSERLVWTILKFA